MHRQDEVFLGESIRSASRFEQTQQGPSKQASSRGSIRKLEAVTPSTYSAGHREAGMKQSRGEGNDRASGLVRQTRSNKG